eukprot:g7133.t1 g7133   contig23:1941255-1942835(-)
MSISSVGSSDNSHGSTKKKHQQQWNGRGGKNRRSGEEKQLALVHKVSTEKYEDDSMTLHDIKGRIATVAKDQEGSRFIQERLELADASELESAFAEVLPALRDLVNDVYGNFAVQGLLEFGTDAMKKEVGENLAVDIVSLSSKAYGCRIVQKAIETLDKNDVASLVSSFKGQVLSCIFDLNANHVIQKFLTVISEHAREAHEQGDQDLALSLTQSLDVIVDEVINDCEELCKHAYGCRVVQRLVEHGLDPIQSRVLDNVIACHESLIDDKFGNYVIGRLIACGRKEDREAIVKTMSGNVLKFSKNKQASNVVEAMLQHGDVAQRKKILQEMLNCFCVDKERTVSAVVSMAEDQYANYVLKKAMDAIDQGEQRVQMFDTLADSLAELEESPYAKQIVIRVKSYLQQEP